MLSIFTVVWSLLEFGWKLVCAAGEAVWKLAMGSLHIGIHVAGAVLDLVMTPFCWVLDHVLDLSVWSRWDLSGILWWGLSALLAACVVIALAAAANNAYRRFRRR